MEPTAAGECLPAIVEALGGFNCVHGSCEVKRSLTNNTVSEVWCVCDPLWFQSAVDTSPLVGNRVTNAVVAVLGAQGASKDVGYFAVGTKLCGTQQNVAISFYAGLGIFLCVALLCIGPLVVCRWGALLAQRARFDCTSQVSERVQRSQRARKRLDQATVDYHDGRIKWREMRAAELKAKHGVVLGSVLGCLRSLCAAAEQIVEIPDVHTRMLRKVKEDPTTGGGDKEKTSVPGARETEEKEKKTLREEHSLFVANERVHARFRGGNTWMKATVTRSNGDGTCNIRYRGPPVDPKKAAKRMSATMGRSCFQCVSGIVCLPLIVLQLVVVLVGVFLLVSVTLAIVVSASRYSRGESALFMPKNWSRKPLISAFFGTANSKVYVNFGVIGALAFAFAVIFRVCPAFAKTWSTRVAAYALHLPVSIILAPVFLVGYYVGDFLWLYFASLIVLKSFDAFAPLRIVTPRLRLIVLALPYTIGRRVLPGFNACSETLALNVPGLVTQLVVSCEGAQAPVALAQLFAVTALIAVILDSQLVQLFDQTMATYLEQNGDDLAEILPSGLPRKITKIAFASSAQAAKYLVFYLLQVLVTLVAPACVALLRGRSSKFYGFPSHKFTQVCDDNMPIQNGDSALALASTLVFLTMLLLPGLHWLLRAFAPGLPAAQNCLRLTAKPIPTAELTLFPTVTPTDVSNDALEEASEGVSSSPTTTPTTTPTSSTNPTPTPTSPTTPASPTPTPTSPTTPSKQPHRVFFARTHPYAEIFSRARFAFPRCVRSLGGY